MKICIISASIRLGRNSHRLALFFKNYIEDHTLATVEILDLYTYQFPLFNERLRYMKNPSVDMLSFAEKIQSADGVIIVTPEYNGGYPASLKNVIDLLYPEWKRKPVAIAAASDGRFGGTQVITSLLFTLWKIGVWIVPGKFHATNVQDAYDESGIPVDKAGKEKKAKLFLDELLWCMEAQHKMKTH